MSQTRTAFALRTDSDIPLSVGEEGAVWFPDNSCIVSIELLAKKLAELPAQERGKLAYMEADERIKASKGPE
jgi:hypothetical protein